MTPEKTQELLSLKDASTRQVIHKAARKTAYQQSGHRIVSSVASQSIQIIQDMVNDGKLEDRHFEPFKGLMTKALSRPPEEGMVVVEVAWKIFVDMDGLTDKQWTWAREQLQIIQNLTKKVEGSEKTRELDRLATKFDRRIAAKQAEWRKFVVVGAIFFGMVVISWLLIAAKLSIV